MMEALRCYCLLAIAGIFFAMQIGKVRTNAIFNESALKEMILKNMTEKEIHHFFGDLTEPVFHFVRPTFIPHSCPDLQGKVRVIIRSPELSVDSILASADILAPHLTSVTVGGEKVDLKAADACHFRASNVSHVISINNCSHNGLDGIIITPEQIATLHPLPQRFIHLFKEHLCTPPDSDDVSKGRVYGVHIFHVAKREDLPVHGRKKREAEEQEPMVCATGPEHDRSRHLDTIGDTHTRPQYFRNLNEIVSDSDLDEFQVQPDDEIHNHTTVAQPVMVVTKKTVELAVFGDKDLYNNFPENINIADKSRMVNYVLTLINAVQGIYHQEELQGFVIDIRVVRLDIHTSNEGPSNGGGDIGAYLTSFCSWQQPQNPQGDGNPEHWDHSIMLSGLDLHSAGNPSVIGLAWVGGMCRPSISCTMNEGRSFMSVYVVAHEMGHNLGMNHDGQGDAQQCSSSKYIMSPSVGPGKTTWSSCSIRVIHNFLQRSTCLDDGEQGRATGRAANTLTNDHHDVMLPHQHMSEATVDLQAILHRTPGYQFALPDQCKAMFGLDYYPALTKFDLCDYLYCTNGVVTKPAHPALEGSFCGSHRVCIAGKCRPEEELARLILYNIPSISHGGGTASPNIVSATSLTTDSSTQSLKPSTEEPYTTPIVTPISSTEIPVISPGTCSCSVTTSTPHSLKNIPREICPFIAPVYHPLFNCAKECSEYDLYIDLSSGNVTKIPNEMIQLEKAAESCFFGSYTIISDKQTRMLSEAVIKDLRGPLRDPSVCQALPHLLHPALQCPDISPLGLEKECIPQDIIVKMADHNSTYVLEKHEGNIGRALHGKGNNYTLLKNAKRDDDVEEARTLFVPLAEQNEKDSQFGFIKCDLEAKFPKELENLPKEICQFLAPSLHDLFNCSVDSKCSEYVLFINLMDNNVTKVPVKTTFEQELPCTVCQQQEQITSSVVFDIIQAIINITLEPANFCKLLPSSWLTSIHSCTTEAVRASVLDDSCLPIKIIVQADDTSFIYNSVPGHKNIKNKPMIEWQGQSYVLKKITSNEEVMSVLDEDLDFVAQVSMKSFSHELNVIPFTESIASSGRKLTANGKFDSHSGLFIDDTSQGTSPRTLYGALPNQPLQEYIGQKDIFLPLNAPKAMPRTKVGSCSVSCGVGMRLIQMECVDVMTNQVVDEDSCQGYLIPTRQLEACHMPQCQPPRWSIGDWGTCSETCGAGVQYRSVECAIQIDQDKDELREEINNLLTQANLVVDDQQCEGKPPHRYRDCEGSCLPAPWCGDEEDCFSYDDIQISRDFDY